MKLAVPIIILIIIVIVVTTITRQSQNNSSTQSPVSSLAPSDEAFTTQIVAQNLDTPWGIGFLPNKDILVTQRSGEVYLVQNSQTQPVGKITNATEIGEGGLLGIAVDPKFSINNLVYLYYTYKEQNSNTLNRVVRMQFKDSKLSNEEILIDAIPGASNHNGGRIKFGPDGKLYIGTGDAQEPSEAQNPSSFAGKIISLDEKNVEIYSLGHRNVQGLTWDKNGQLFATEHGRSGIQSGLDELNKIVKGGNYGWPDSQGDTIKPGTTGPVKHSGNDTWAPSGLAYLDGSFYFAGLRGQALYEAVLDGGKVVEFKQHFKGELGRIREAIVGPDGMLYITTSNKDGRGTPKSGDDKIIRINPKSLK